MDEQTRCEAQDCPDRNDCWRGYLASPRSVGPAQLGRETCGFFLPLKRHGARFGAEE